MNFAINSTDIKQIFFLENSNFFLIDSFFGDLEISTGLFLIKQNTYDYNYTLLIENTIFANISGNYKNLFVINGIFQTIVISKSIFFAIRFFGLLMQVINTNATIILDSSNFENNSVIDNLINIEFYFNFTIKNSIITFSNLNGVFDQLLSGGSIILTNGAFRKIVNLTISDCYSEKSILGLKIIDNINRETYETTFFSVT